MESKLPEIKEIKRYREGEIKGEKKKEKMQPAMQESYAKKVEDEDEKKTLAEED